MFEITIIILMLMFNAVFAAFEMGLASISRTRIIVLADKKIKGALQAAFMKERVEGSLATVQIGITLFAAIAAATGGAGVEENLAPYLQAHLGLSDQVSEFIAIILFVIPLSLATIVFAELIPKMIALNNKEWIVLRLSPVMKALFITLYPLIAIIEKVVKRTVIFFSRKVARGEQTEKTESLHELKAAVSVARTSQLLGLQEEKIVLSAAQLSVRKAREIMTPESEISMIWAGNSVLETFIKVHLDMHTRFPVCEKDNDSQSIIGYLNFKDVPAAVKTTSPEMTAKAITRPIIRINENVSLSTLLEKMIRENVHIALVVNESQVLGMITLEDIIEELVGDIKDEFDLIPGYIQSYGTDWIVGGNALITTVASTAGLDWSGKYISTTVPTISQWCAEKLGRHPKGGDIIESDNLRVIVRKFRRGKMAEAMVSIIKEEQ